MKKQWPGIALVAILILIVVGIMASANKLSNLRLGEEKATSPQPQEDSITMTAPPPEMAKLAATPVDIYATPASEEEQTADVDSDTAGLTSEQTRQKELEYERIAKQHGEWLRQRRAQQHPTPSAEELKVQQQKLQQAIQQRRTKLMQGRAEYNQSQQQGGR